MIRHNEQVDFVTPLGVTKQMRKTAECRRGEWVIETYDWDKDAPERSWWERLFGTHIAEICGYNRDGHVLRKTTIRLTEKEIPRMLHIFTHGVRNKTKLESIHSNLEQAAESLWPTGSLEHVAMRFLAVPLLVRVFTGHKEFTPEMYIPGSKLQGTTSKCGAAAIVAFVVAVAIRHLRRQHMAAALAVAAAAAACFTPVGKKHWRTQLVRYDGQPSGAANHTAVPAEPIDGKNANSNSADGDNTSKEPVTILEPAPAETPKLTDPEELPRELAFKHGGNTPEDADIIASEQHRVVDKDGIKMIVGQDFDGMDPDRKQIVGVLTAPTPKMPNVYNNSSKNAKAAKRERLDKKARPYEKVDADVKKINKLIGNACGNNGNRSVFSEKRIKRWAEEFLHLDQIKSGKWSNKRCEDALNNLHKQAYPQMNLKCAVKLEPMAEGKAPRLLIADGDDGQLMALVVIKCFEELLFEWFEDKSIKHTGKRDAIARTIRNLTKSGARLVEGDGSAWDTTCNASIRALVENTVLRHIAQVLIPYGVVPEQWHEEHLKCNEKKSLKLFFDGKMDKMRMTIDAIRRSGHRGTSCLNWWMNFVNWACSIFKEPEKFLDPTARKATDETGRERWWNGVFEGDDSLCALSPPMLEGDAMHKYFIGWWTRQGFNMNIVCATRRATFCGYHIACVEGEPTGLACPELPRAIVGAGVSCSSTIIQAAKDGNIDLVKDIAAAGAIARAADFAGILPTVSRKFHQYAMEVKRSREVVDREMSMRVMGEEGHNFTEIEQSIEARNLAVTPTEEVANLAALSYDATSEELDTFMLQSWTFEGIGAFDEHRTSLPDSWRPSQ